MKCNKCGEEFDPAHLDQVIAHEHDGLHLATGITGKMIIDENEIESLVIKKKWLTVSHLITTIEDPVARENGIFIAIREAYNNGRSEGSRSEREFPRTD